MLPDLHRVENYRTGNSFVLLYHIEKMMEKEKEKCLLKQITLM